LNVSRRRDSTAAVPASFAALAIVVTAIGVWRPPLPGHDVVRQLDREFRQLLPHLPRTGVVGYLAPSEGSDVADEQRLFYAAQFSLAPLVIVRRQEPEFVIVPRGHAVQDDPRLAGLFVSSTTSAGHRVYRRLTR
jgi:hypothetical protein